MRRLSPLVILAGAVVTSALVGCFVEPGGEGDPNAAADPGTDGTSNDPTPVLDDAGQPIATGVPCEIEKILATHCSSCHGAKPSAPSRLVTFADLTATSVNDKTKTEAEEALARMESTTSPMPPSGTKPTAQEIAAFKAWVTANTPMGVECGAADGGSTHVSDAGTKDAAPAPNPYATPLVCTSKKTWSGGYSSTMHPGVACIGCHSFNIAGTVYPTAHEPDNCNGVAGGMSVVVTDAHNKTATIAVNSAGNFLYAPSVKLVAPFTVKVVSSKGTRVMAGKAPNGNCNSCHTVKGASGAPGRIMAP